MRSSRLASQNAGAAVDTEVPNPDDARPEIQRFEKLLATANIYVGCGQQPSNYD